MVVDNDVLAAAAGIHSVEPRHAAFLNLVNDASSFPAGVDEPQSMAEATEIAVEFAVEEEPLSKESFIIVSDSSRPVCADMQVRAISAATLENAGFSRARPR